MSSFFGVSYYPGDGKPITHRFSGTWFSDGDTALSLSPPLGQHMQQAALVPRLSTPLSGWTASLSPQPRPLPPSEAVGTLSPTWRGLAGPRQRTRMIPAALCGYEPKEGQPAGSCPGSLEHCPHPSRGPQMTALRRYSTEQRRGGVLKHSANSLPQKAGLNTCIS